MALSLNWKALSSKLQPGKVAEVKTKTANIQRKRKYQSKNASDIRKAHGVITPAPTRHLTPLEFALWTSPSHSKFRVEPGNAKIQVDYADKKKRAPGKFVAIDCEFVGVGPGDESALARVSIVNYFGVELLDTYVKPEGRVTNWRTWVSGVAPQHMHSAISFNEARKKVGEIISDRIVVGHAVHNDLSCLNISVPKHRIRDTSRFPDFKKLNGGKTPALKKLCLVLLGIDIQNGQHSSVEDAQATMAIFRLHQKAMEGHFAR